MKRTIFRSIFLLLLLTIFFLVWLHYPCTFLNSINADDIAVIHVRNGNNGNLFSIENEDDISYIVTHIQEQTFCKKKISLFYTGEYFTLSFCGKNEKVLAKFTVNSNTSIRKDPFFYQTETNDMQIIEFLELYDTKTGA